MPDTTSREAAQHAFIKSVHGVRAGAGRQNFTIKETVTLWAVCSS
jgi:hypothetical protein